MNEQFNDIRKKMEAKGYEYIQEIEAYFEHGHIDDSCMGDYAFYALFGKQLGNITIFRVCGKYEYEITTASRTIYYNHNGRYIFDSLEDWPDQYKYSKIHCNAQFTSNSGRTWYFCNPYWN